MKRMGGGNKTCCWPLLLRSCIYRTNEKQREIGRYEPWKESMKECETRLPHRKFNHIREDTHEKEASQSCREGEDLMMHTEVTEGTSPSMPFLHCSLASRPKAVTQQWRRFFGSKSQVGRWGKKKRDSARELSGKPRKLAENDCVRGGLSRW
jgi:hypothetical protein